jgi:diguanylate cyclase (GGDEF)-like protein
VGRTARGGSGDEVEDLLKSDLFRFTRSDRGLAQLVRTTKQATPRPYWQLLRALLGVGERMDETSARATWRQIVAHRRALSTQLGRQVALRVAAFDWLSLQDESERPTRPVVLSHAALAQVVARGGQDALTGLPRRARFERALDRELKRQPFVGGCVVFIDLDGFKRANDRLGHASGDAVLRRFARVARSTLRGSDVVARLGGDEFGLLLGGLDTRQARRIVERLRGSFEQDCTREAVSFSFGAAALCPRAHAAVVLSRADAAMYRQKARRKASATRR